VIADHELDAARKIAEWAGPNTVEVRQVDIYDDAALDAAVRGSDCVINAANYYHNLQVMNGCLRAGVPYVDLGGLYHMTLRQLELDSAFREAGLTAIIGMGADPGVTNVQAGYAARALDSIDSIRIYDGILPEPDTGGGISWGYSPATILDEFTMNPVAFRDGRMIELPPLAEPEEYAFAGPVGVRLVHHSLHSELATFPQSFRDRGIREVGFKISQFGFCDAVFERLRTLVDLGLASTEPVSVGGASIRPRDVLVAVVSQQSPGSALPIEETAEELVTEVRGADAGGPLKVTVRTLSRGSTAWGIDGGALVTGMPPSIVAAWIAEGRLRAPGVQAPELAVEPEPFFEELRRRGIETSYSLERPLGGGG